MFDVFFKTKKSKGLFGSYFLKLFFVLKNKENKEKKKKIFGSFFFFFGS